ncbi:MAG TPA: hypothetical protein PKG52_05645 [bacterium]|nr:hypothetical protein [bacterium]HPS29069.1 hypothetical protein [bacterium]
MKYFLLILIFIIAGCASTGTGKEEPAVKKISPEIVIFVTPSTAKELIDAKQENSEDFKFLFDMANKYFDLGKYSESSDLYMKIINEDPDNEDIQFCHYNLGLINMKLFEWDNAAIHFEKAFTLFEKVSDRTDAFLNYMESLKKAGKWDAVLSETEKAVNSYFSGRLNEKLMTEMSLRMAEALIMTGKPDEGRKLAQYWDFEIRKKYPRYEAVYIPDLAFADYVSAISFVYDFSKIRIDSTIETLTEKCRNIVEAQKEFIKSINVGVVFWSNASAFEISRMYMDLYSEMESYPVPEELNDEEKEIYKCELWNKTANLLKKSRKILLKSMDVAKKAKEENEYLEKSSSMVKQIDEIYDSKESACGKYLKKQELR